MEHPAILNHATLKVRINELKVERSMQEDALKDSLKAFAVTLNPLSILKGSVQGFSKDKELRTDILKAGLNLGTDFIIEKVLGRSRSVKGFLSSILVEKLSAPFINKIVMKLFSGSRNPGIPDPEEDFFPDNQGRK